MIPNAEVMTIKGELDGEETRMGFDPAATQHLMQVLTNLYSDSELAVIREYATNALDSHIFAGTERPIEVHTPNSFTNEFIVQDFGLGLSKDEILNIYGQYGASTKRDSDKVTGMLGLGCKSALAYTNTFTLVGVKDGHKTHAVIFLAEDGAGTIKILIEEETDEPNGVTVKIPSKKYNGFNEKVRNFFKYWDKGLVLVDGEAPVHFTDTENTVEINPGLWITPTNFRNGVYIVMGNVPYYCGDYNTRWNLAVVIKADMGSVDFTPNRETLNMTTRTRDYVKTLVKYVNDLYPTIMQNKIDNAETITEAVRVASTLNDRVMKWNGVKFDLNPYKKHFNYKIHRRSCSSVEHIRYRDLYTDGASTVVIKEKVSFTPLSYGQRNKLEHLLKERGLSYDNAIYFAGPIPYLASELPTIDWDDIVNIKLPKTLTSGTRNTTPLVDQEWEAFTGRGQYSSSMVLDPESPIIYLSGKLVSNYSWNINQFTPRMMTALPNDVQVVKVPVSRHGSFQRAFPKAVKWDEWIHQYVAEVKDSLEDDDYELMAISDRRALGVFANRTDDPKIDALAKLNSVGDTRLTQVLRVCNTLGIDPPKSTHDDYMAKNYPLVKLDHLVESVAYINFKYKSLNKNKRKKAA